MRRQIGSQRYIAVVYLWQKVIENSKLMTKSKEVTREMGSDEAGAPSDEYLHIGLLQPRSFFILRLELNLNRIVIIDALLRGVEVHVDTSYSHRVYEAALPR